MPAAVLYFQIHQPHRLRRYSVFDTGADYFDQARNTEICRKVADKSYRPGLHLLLDQVRRHEGRFRLALSITGTAIEQLEDAAPDVVSLLQDLAATGCVEFLAETYHHSLAILRSKAEFDEQIDLHTRRIEHLFGQTPRVFRNTELIYCNDSARHICSITGPDGLPRFAGQFAEGVDSLLEGRGNGRVFTPPGNLCGGGGNPYALLLRNHRLSDDVAFRFSNRGWREWPLTPDKFARWLADAAGPLVNLCMDFETFGEHQWADTGIFQFLTDLPQAFLATGPDAAFLTPSEALDRHIATATYDAPLPTSWADASRDLSPWLGNAMQVHALDEIYRLEARVKARVSEVVAGGEDESLALQMLDQWRRLTTSDHFYYMSTKGAADGAVHAYFRPYESPYDAYITYMNVLEDFKRSVLA
jgi:alpha-amylase